MPKIFRSMKSDGGRPKVGAEPSCLGVRVPDDIALDDDGTVSPCGRRISENRSLESLSLSRIPKRYRDRVEGAKGPNSLSVWTHGRGEFATGPVIPKLLLNVDSADHGNVGPAARMPV